MFLSWVTRDEVQEKNNQLNGGFEVPNCHSTKTVLCNKVYTNCMHKSIVSVFCWIYASGREKATLGYRYKTLDRKPCPWSQSYIGPTISRRVTYFSSNPASCNWPEMRDTSWRQPQPRTSSGSNHDNMMNQIKQPYHHIPNLEYTMTPFHKV